MSLVLAHPTAKEKLETWTLNGKDWGTALGMDSYLEREEYLTTVPVAANGGITHWILVDSSARPDDRAIYASSESLRKRAFVCTPNGTLKEVITHGIGSVFCASEYRGKGYAVRMLKELSPALRDWQMDKDIPGREECGFSFLYSDIGKSFYSKLGWKPFPSHHISLYPSTSAPKSTSVKPLQYADLPALCELDVENLRESLRNVKSDRPQVALIPDHDVMQYHHLREDFMTRKIFGKSPTTKGAIVGKGGTRVWAIWTRAFYGPLDERSGNKLYILRLVVEDGKINEANSRALKDILQLAQAEAELYVCLAMLTLQY